MKYDAPAGYVRVSDVLAPFYADMVDGYYLRRGTWIGDCCDILATTDCVAWTPSTLEMGDVPRQTPTGSVERWFDYVDRYTELITSESFKAKFSRCLAVQEESINEVEHIIGHSDQRWLMTDGREAIIDVKTGAVRKAVAIQTALYDLGTPINRRRRRFSIHLTAEKAVLTEWKDSRDYDAGRILARAHHVAKDYR